MRYLEKEINNGRNLEANVPKFSFQMMEIYKRYSAIKLSMNYFTYYEMTSETKISDKQLLKLTARLSEIISAWRKSENTKNLTEAGTLIEEQLNKITEIREEVITIMKGLTAWVDVFNIYEYCLNRVEYRFKDAPVVSDEELARDILKYIVSDKDQAVVNSKICETVRQLPVRMTKNHFFELLRSGINVYKESDKSTIDDFLYMIRTVSMLEIPESAYAVSENITEIYHEFQTMDFKFLDAESFQNASQKLQYCVNFIQTHVDYYMMLMENINDTYVLLISSGACLASKFPALFKKYSDDKSELLADTKDYQNSVLLIEKECALFSGVPYGELCEEIEDRFLFLEGRQEWYGTLIQHYSYLCDTISQNTGLLNKLNAAELADLFSYMDKLTSGSLFVEFKKTVQEGQADNAYLSKIADDLEQEFVFLFKKQNKQVNRAVMAHVLSELPIFFNNMEEIKNYIITSLSGCGDLAEKAAVAEIFQNMTAQDS